MILLRKTNNNALKGLIIFLILIIHILAFFFLNRNTLYSDEYIHYDQINRFLTGKLTLHPGLTIIPTFHIVIAFFGNIFSQSSITAIRFIVFILDSLSLFIFYLVAKTINSENSLLKTLQFYFLPIIYPFFFIIYTDIFSLSLLLISTYYVLKNKNFLSFVFAFLSILVRQNNIVWYCFIFFLIYIRTNDCSLNKN